MKLIKQNSIRGLFGDKKYSVDLENGEILSNYNGKIQPVVGNILPNGYLQCALSLGFGEKIVAYKHEIVYLYKYGCYPPNFVIDHKDGNKQNNKIDNLQAITQRQNLAKGNLDHRKLNKHKKPRKTEQEKQQMVELYKQGNSFASIAKQFLCARYNVSVIIRNRLKK